MYRLYYYDSEDEKYIYIFKNELDMLKQFSSIIIGRIEHYNSALFNDKFKYDQDTLFTIIQLIENEEYKKLYELYINPRGKVQPCISKSIFISFDFEKSSYDEPDEISKEMVKELSREVKLKMLLK